MPRHSRRGPARPVVAGLGVRPPRVPPGPGGARTPGPGRHLRRPRRRHCQPHRPASDAQRATRTAARSRDTASERVPDRPAPTCPRPPRRPQGPHARLPPSPRRCQVSARHSGSAAPRPRRPSRRPRPARQSPALIGSYSHPSRSGPPPAPPGSRREGTAPVRVRPGARTLSGTLVARTPAWTSSQSPCPPSCWLRGDGPKFA